jgi:hypothetical protein
MATNLHVTKICGGVYMDIKSTIPRSMWLWGAIQAKLPDLRPKYFEIFVLCLHSVT